MTDTTEKLEREFVFDVQGIPWGEEQHGRAMILCRKMLAALKERDAENERLRVALAFYADGESYAHPMIFKECGCVHDRRGWNTIAVLQDDGDIARAALEGEDD